MKKISEDIIYVGADDLKLDLFENQYALKNGVSYNSYVIKDRKIVVMDTVDERATDWWFDNLEEAFDGKAPDYLVISHLEPDHSANIESFMHKYPETVIVANAKTFAMLPQFVNIKLDDDRKIVVAEGDELKLGKHTLKFIMAPMVHWPEVMVSFELSEKILFSADCFGKFGTLGEKLFADEFENAPECRIDEARRYYTNIVGKYGVNVQQLLKKVKELDISIIAPLHGSVIRKDLNYFIDKYDKWSSYKPEQCGTVIAYATLHGNTRKAAIGLAEQIKNNSSEPVYVFDLSRDDMSETVARAFQVDKLVLAGVTYDAGLMPCMEDFLYHLKMKNYQGRKVAIIENGSWGPIAGKLMNDYIAAMKNIQLYENVITIRTRMNTQNVKQLSELTEWLLK